MRLHPRHIFFVLLGIGRILYSQDEQIEKIFNSNGLITDMKLDQNGLIWITSYGGDGVYHFNGSSFEKLVTDDFNEQDSTTLSSDRLTSLEIDSSNNLWIGTYGNGLQYFDRQTGVFSSFRADSANSNSVVDDRVADLLIDQNGTLWIATEQGLSMKEVGSDSFKTYYPSRSISTLYEDAKGNVWICFGGKFGDLNAPGALVRYNPSRQSFDTILDDESELRSIFSVFVESDSERIWLSVYGEGIGRLSARPGFSFDKKLPGDTSLLEAYEFILFKERNYLWSGIYNTGLYLYDVAGDSLVSHLDRTTTNQADADTDLIYPTSFIYDAEVGVFWLGTDDGIYSVKRSSLRIPFYSFPYYESNSMYLHRNVLLIATSDHGLVQKNLSTGETRIWSDQKEIADYFIPGLITSYVLRVDKYTKQIWLGTTNKGLCKIEYDPTVDYPFLAIKDVVFYSHKVENPNSILDNQVNGLIVGRDGWIYMATASGLSCYNTRGEKNVNEGEFRNYVHNPNDEESLGSTLTICVEEDFRGDIWVGGDEGISRLNRVENTFTNFELPLVKDICVDRNGVVWAATRMGLYYFDQRSKQMQKLTKEAIGVSIDNVIGINEYLENILWVTTKDQIIQIAPDRKSVLILGENQGVRYNKMGWQDNYTSFDEEIFIGHHNGFYLLNPKSFNGQEVPGPVLNLTQLKLANQVVNPEVDGILTQPLNSTERIQLDYDQNTFSIEFTGVDYVFDEQLDYRFMLEGYNQGWSDLGNDNRIFFFQVPPDKYTLKIAATNAAGIVTTRSIDILIGKPWWLKWYSYLSYVAFLSLAIFTVHKIQKARTLRKERERVKDQRLQQALEIERAYGQLRVTQNQLIHAEKMASLGELTAGIAHEIQNPLNFVNNFSEVNRELLHELEEELEKGDIEEIRALSKDLVKNEVKILHHGKRAEEIVKSMLQHSRGTEGKKELVDINALADEYLRLSYHGLRAKDKSFNAKFECKLDPSIPEVMAIPQEIGRVLLNLINNAFHATDEKAKTAGPDYVPSVTVITAKSEEMVGVVVKDNGPGIPEEIQSKIFQPFFTTKQTGSGTGLGLSLSYDIITKGHNGMIDVKTVAGEGTEFIFTLPIQVNESESGG